ncbi:mitochondrial amidoxime-reducing component 1-like isoform X2 [Liolophura sinensis]
MRKEPRMTLIKTEVQDDFLLFNAPGMETLRLPKEQSVNSKNLRRCRIWDDNVKVVDSGEEASHWFSSFMNKVGLRLMYYAPGIPKREAISQRKPWEHKAQPGDRAAFADFAAYMIASTDSLDVLNQNLSTAVSIRNFRPNIVVSGNGAFKEETWSEIRIGDASFRALDLCARCLQTTVNPDTGDKCVKQEPLATLKKLNSNLAYTNKAIFGVNAALDTPGRIHIGDKVYALIA